MSHIEAADIERVLEAAGRLFAVMPGVDASQRDELISALITFGKRTRQG